MLGSLQFLIAFCVDRSHEMLNTDDKKIIKRCEVDDTNGETTKTLKSLNPVLTLNNHVKFFFSFEQNKLNHEQNKNNYVITV